MKHRTNIVTAPLRLRWRRTAAPAFFAFALATTACGGSGSSKSGSGGSGGSGGATGGSAGMDAGPDVSAPNDAGSDHGQPDVSQPDAGPDACQKTNGSVEICDGVDNDCNGKIDDVLAGDAGAHVGDPCGKCNGHWVCPSFGPPVCNDDGGPTTEICDGIDNDCNGLIDDGLTSQACDVPNTTGLTYQSTEPQSACKRGSQSCTKTTAGWGPCTGYVGPTTETCDGKDDDCNGIVDDVSDPNGLHTCTGCKNGVSVTAEETCTNGTWTCPLSQPLHWYLDADGDKHPQPNSNWKDANGNPVYGAVIMTNLPTGTSCAPPYQNDGGSNAGWISTPYDWSQASQRAADSTYPGIDCCDTDARAYENEPNYYQAPTDKPLPVECIAQGVQAWDFDCNNSLSKLPPDPNAPSGIKWNTCANCTGTNTGWDIIYGCPKDCGVTSGNWIKQCGEAHSQDLTGYSPFCK